MENNILEFILPACADLLEVLKSTNDNTKREEILLKHFNLCLQKNLQLDDFPSGLEWFNVSRPLTLSGDLKGKVVLLDFFTYCCINCLHLFPYIKQVEEEFSVADGFVVVGVHSAKFDNEKDSANILAAIQRYNLTHPVMNDSGGILWNQLGIGHWPTLLLLGPNKEVLFLLAGEGMKHELPFIVRTALKHYAGPGQLSGNELPLAPASHLLAEKKGVSLLFPGKVASCQVIRNDFHQTPKLVSDQTVAFGANLKEPAVPLDRFVHKSETERLAVADTGNHRILILTTSGKLEFIVGGDKLGFVDGHIHEAKFNCPQGVAFRNPNVLYVGDTENHAIREINLKTLQVSTVAGTGSQGDNLEGGRLGVDQPLSSPWDLCMVSRALVPCRKACQCETCGSAGGRTVEDILLVAMAGAHQIWGLFLNDTFCWRQRVFPAGSIAAIAGSGKEENRNNAYSHAAAFAQPSGLSYSSELNTVFIADSESSSIRRFNLTTGQVSAVVGGDRDPFNLFSFGDVDGKQYEAKLQHPLGVAWSPQNKKLYVADSYNHKVKVVDVEANTCDTLFGIGQSGDQMGPFNVVQLNEPGGLCLSPDETRLFVADTNNHSIKIVDLVKGTVEKMDIVIPADAQILPDNQFLHHTLPIELKVSPSGGIVNLLVTMKLDKGFDLTALAPQKWIMTLPNRSWSASSCAGEYVPDMKLKIEVPSGPPGLAEMVYIDYKLYLCCNDSSCMARKVRLPIRVLQKAGASTNVTHHWKHLLGLKGLSSSSVNLS
uniref:Thioredoxin domain-containing protein n=1 Tax=Timema douglasi TaxID=61478 RepID=A0A7R8ZBH1_TIMDO|nr:unnamed protein product [Timema douglasi]